MMSKFLDYLTLFTSSGTLICCALPALLVALGAGSVMASLISTFPTLIWFSIHKLEIFIFAGAMLSIGGVMQYRARNMPCPIDKNLAAACMRSRKLSFITYIFSLLLFLIGGFFAFIAPKII